jgi:hypothetical protein
LSLFWTAANNRSSRPRFWRIAWLWESGLESNDPQAPIISCKSCSRQFGEFESRSASKWQFFVGSQKWPTTSEHCLRITDCRWVRSTRSFAMQFTSAVVHYR